MNLGQRLKEARIKAGLTQEELASQLGVSRQTISSWENDRSAPDIGSAVKLGKLYDTSLDTLLSGQEVIQHFEDLVAKRRKFWQRMLELGVLGELLGNLLKGLDFTGAGTATALAGTLLLNLAIVMHLRVFDHSRGQIFRGLLGLAGIWTLALLAWILPEASALLILSLRLICLLLILSARVWTIDWKSTLLWLLFFLYLGSPLLLVATHYQDQGQMVENTPIPGSYRIDKILYPEGQEATDVTLIELGGTNLLYISLDGIHSERIGHFTYTPPTEGEAAKGLWRLVPEEAPNELYLLTLEADDSVTLSYTRDGNLQWKWLLKNDLYIASVMVSTRGKTSFRSADWYPEGIPLQDYTYNRAYIDIVTRATLKLQVYNLESLTLYEEYHHDGQVDTQVYALEPEKDGSFQLKVETRYADQEQYALYRIPYGEGAFQFYLSFG